MAYVHTNGIARGWYWEYAWLDLLMHFLGGVIVALLVRWGSERVWGVRFSLATVILAVLFVGIAWEVFEYALGLIEVPRDVYIKDTAVDLILDMLGAALVALCRRNCKTSDVPRRAETPSSKNQAPNKSQYTNSNVETRITPCL
ncbi:MAG: hypothetical protein Q8R39_03780 [bacterium]|nr:hypothetical protein [bacterium]MDZ4284374.1 hypothetical protein [Patescibacteria group bacterium]